MQVKIAKFEKYPAEFPTGYAVGFDITFENGRSQYIDTIVSLDLTEDEAVPAAWQNVKASVENFKNTVGALPKLVGAIFTPPVEVEEEQEVAEEQPVAEEVVEEEEVPAEEEVVEEAPAEEVVEEETQPE